MIHPDHGAVKFDETMFGSDDGKANEALSDHRPVRIEMAAPEKDDD